MIMSGSRLNVLFLVESLAGGGAEKILSGLVRGLDRDKFNVTVCAVVDCGQYRDEVRKHARYRFIVGGRGWLYRLKYALVYRFLPAGWIYKWFIAGDYDVEAAFIEGYATRIASGSPNPDSRKLAWVHIDLAANHWTLPAYRNAEEEKRAYRQFDTVVSVSRDVRESVVALAGPLRDARVLYNPIDAQAIREKSAEFVPQRPEGKMLFCASGRLVPQKGFDRLAEACRHLVQAGFSFHLWILGEGPEGRKLKALAGEWGLQDRITFLGHRENPYPYMRAADWMVCSSRSEGHSTVISESLVLGIPVVSTLCSGVREQLGDGEFGLVAGNNKQDLLRALEDILTGRADRRDYGERALRGGSRFDLDGRMSALEGLFETTH